MHSHGEGTIAADGTRGGAEVGGVVGAACGVADGVGRGAGSDADGNRGRKPRRFARSRGIGELIEVGPGAFLIDGIGAADKLAVVDVKASGCAVQVIVDRLSSRRVGACVRLANLRLVLRHVEAGGVGYVERVEFILQSELFCDVESLADGEIQALLHCLAEDVALPGVEGRFVDVLRIVTGGHRNAHLTRREVVNGNLGGIDGRDVAAARPAERAFISRESRFRMCGILDSQNRVHEVGIVAKVDAAHRAVELIQ